MHLNKNSEDDDIKDLINQIPKSVFDKKIRFVKSGFSISIIDPFF